MTVEENQNGGPHIDKVTKVSVNRGAVGSLQCATNLRPDCDLITSQLAGQVCLQISHDEKGEGDLRRVTFGSVQCPPALHVRSSQILVNGSYFWLWLGTPAYLVLCPSGQPSHLPWLVKTLS